VGGGEEAAVPVLAVRSLIVSGRRGLMPCDHERWLCCDVEEGAGDGDAAKDNEAGAVGATIRGVSSSADARRATTTFFLFWAAPVGGMRCKSSSAVDMAVHVACSSPYLIVIAVKSTSGGRRP